GRPPPNLWVFSWAGSHGSSCSQSSSGTRQLSTASLTPIALPPVLPSGYRSYSRQRVIRIGSKAQDHVGKPMKKTIRAGDGLKLVCEVRGKGDTALVFLHGWCCDREHWKNQVEAFATDYRVVAYDQAGHGESGKDRKEWSGPGLAADVQTVVKEL